MVGRITSVPAENVHGVSYKALLARERALQLELLAKYRSVLESWLAAEVADKNSKTRARLFREAREKTTRLLS